MADLSHYAFVAAIIALSASLALYLVSAVEFRAARVLSLAGGPSAVPSSAPGRTREALGRYGTWLAVHAVVFLTASLGLRALATGHGPFSNMYEFSIAFAWGALVTYLYFEFRYHFRTLALLVVPVSLALLAYATTWSNEVRPLVPALQNNLLLTVHVLVAVVAYGAFTVAFAAGVLYLVQRKNTVRWLPANTVLDEIGYKAVVVGFPMLALVLILGAIWAEIAWGTYWSWDPKETAALFTWLVYGGYLHARVMRGWRGNRSAVFLIVGFGATLFTYFGNLFFGGLHSYA
ncbi:MAG: c-type cytochrome biogenesis protein CcsB [Dehalococcoidia bacterium]|nr:c-type cytochrome biogenesis protein CcsB [Dehalococcoidia bacterium]